MPDSRDEHLAWAKQRAREYLDQGDHVNALASFFSDLGKHEETAKIPDRLHQTGLMLVAMSPTPLHEARRWIEGYN